MSPFIETFTGVRFTPLEPKSKDVRLVDIAHALSNQCRFSGHTKHHYSVAQHSVLVSELVQKAGGTLRDQLWALLHDASEAYLVDLPTPLKAQPEFGAAYRAAEARLQASICRAFELPVSEPQIVRWADAVLLSCEVRDLMFCVPEHWVKLTEPPLPDLFVKEMTPREAEYAFLMRFEELMNAKGQ